jgi:hypothetical protein
LRNPPTVAVAPVALPVEEKEKRPVPRKGNQNFDDATEVDLPRAFESGEAPPGPAPARASEPGAPRKPAAVDAFKPRRTAPVVGAPLQPPKRAPDDDDVATEIMSAAIRSKLPDPPPKKPRR